MNYENKANKLNEQQRQEVLLHLNRIIENDYSPSRTSMEILFKYFNLHINCTPDDINCPDCRRAVVNFWKKMKTIWI